MASPVPGPVATRLRCGPWGAGLGSVTQGAFILTVVTSADRRFQATVTLSRAGCEGWVHPRAHCPAPGDIGVSGAGDRA